MKFKTKQNDTPLKGNTVYIKLCKHGQPKPLEIVFYKIEKRTPVKMEM